MAWRTSPLIGALAVLMLTAVPVAADSQQQGAQGRHQMLEDRVFVRLAEEAWAGGDFKVNADGDTITLSGTVPSEQSKQRMLRIARRTPGVAEVRDQLRVQPGVASAPDATTVPDRQLAQRAAQRIADAIPGAKTGEDWWLTGWRVEGPDNRWSFTVEAEKGDVWLEGEVPRHRHIRQAIEAARQTAGVRSVRSNLSVDPPYYGRRYGDPYAAWGRPYGYGPYAYDTDYDRVNVDDGTSAHGFRGLHAMTGEVTRVDKQKGQLTLKTGEGSLELHFPPTALQHVKRGDRITVELGLKQADASPAASPRMGSDAETSQSGQSPSPPRPASPQKQ